jgi:Methyltransferase FkbM domain
MQLNKDKIKKLLPVRILNLYNKTCGLYRDKYSYRSYSQEGEDMLIRRLLRNKSKGFYIDIGAHHPKRFSNTQYFYRKGWNGINIDALPGTKALFDKYRKKDINIEILVSNKSTLKYYLFDEPAYNTTDEKLIDSVISKGVKLKSVNELQCKKLENILDECDVKGKIIDFMSVDVEGNELDVLQSNNWKKYRPSIICVEKLNYDLNNFSKSNIYKLLTNNGYEVLSKTVNSWYYKNVAVEFKTLEK